MQRCYCPPSLRLIRRPLARGRCSEPAKATRGRERCVFPAARTSPVLLASPYAHAGSYMRMHRACHGHGQGAPHVLCMQRRARTTQAAVPKGAMGSCQGRWLIPGTAGLAKQGNQVTRLGLVPRLREPSSLHTRYTKKDFNFAGPSSCWRGAKSHRKALKF